MSKTFRHHTRVQIDRALSRIYDSLVHQPFATSAFANLLTHVRTRSPLLRPAGDGSQQELALTALRNLASHHDEYLAWPSTWAPTSTALYPLIHGLASHLLGRYPVPRNFGLVWFGGESPRERAERRWFIEHAGGRRFRDIPDLPVAMTRKMERILLSSPDHLPLRRALRRAEILGLGGEPGLVDAIARTPIADDLAHGDFWRSAIHFFINHWAALGPATVVEIVEFLRDYRFRPRIFHTPEGPVTLPPPDPNFSLAGRTPTSLARLIDDWQQGRSRSRTARLCWPSSGIASLACVDRQQARWRFVELLDSEQLRLEGHALAHCVATYTSSCARGYSSIWSLRRRGADGKYHSRCTIEVVPASSTIIQIRCYRNRRARGRIRALIEAWAAAAGLTIADCAW